MGILSGLQQLIRPGAAASGGDGPNTANAAASGAGAAGASTAAAGNNPGSVHASAPFAARFTWRRLPPLADGIFGGRRALALFRYISWFLTSAYYLGAQPGVTPGAVDTPLPIKLVVIAALLAASWVAVRLYARGGTSPSNVFGLVIIDTLFISLLLIPTGGLASPMIWYALNPVFMSISLLPLSHCLAVLVFLGAAVASGAVYHGTTLPGLETLADNPWFSLVFLLLITAVLLFSRLSKQLADAYQKLSVAHQSTERLLEQIAELFQALEEFSAGEDRRALAALLASYAGRLTGSRAGACLLAGGQYQHIWETADPDGILVHLRPRHTENIWQRVREGQEGSCRFPLLHNVLEGKDFVCVPLKTPSAHFGFLGYVVYSNQAVRESEDRAARYLAELVAIVLERRRADDLAASLLVAEEQNRIANEIHDGASQHLFSIVYALHALSGRRGDIQDEEVQQQLGLLKRAANQAARDLRASIYRISPSKRGEHVFTAGVKAYLEDLAALNGIEIYFRPRGSEEALSPALRKSLYRIIREATSNAVRHGRCSRIEIFLEMEPSRVMLRVNDDGQGFDVARTASEGLGLANMRSLTASFSGRFTVESQPGGGTRVTCVVPDDESYPAAAGNETRTGVL